MGTLSDACLVLANPTRVPTIEDMRKVASTVVCRNLDHWSTDDQWQVSMPDGEEIEVVAVGGRDRAFVAVATSKRYMRLYSNNGVPQMMFSLTGPIVSLAARDEQLMVVFHQVGCVAG
jgi:chromosome transmission fidelity protein 4